MKNLISAILARNGPNISLATAPGQIILKKTASYHSDSPTAWRGLVILDGIPTSFSRRSEFIIYWNVSRGKDIYLVKV